MYSATITWNPWREIWETYVVGADRDGAHAGREFARASQAITWLVGLGVPETRTDVRTVNAFTGR